MSNGSSGTGTTSTTWRHFWSQRTRLAGVDECQAERVSQIGLEADRRRDEHRSECAAAVQRIRGRGESVGTIAALANVSEVIVRGYARRT